MRSRESNTCEQCIYCGEPVTDSSEEFHQACEDKVMGSYVRAALFEMPEEVKEMFYRDAQGLPPIEPPKAKS
jgi:hypothetical protein